MKRFIEGEARSQGTLLPGVLDDYVGQNNPVHVADVPTLDSAAANIPSMAASMRAEDWWLVFMAFIADCRFIDVSRHERAIK